MPSSPSTYLGLTAPLGTEAPDGPANFTTLITQLEASAAMVRIAELSPAGGIINFTAIPQVFRHLRIEGTVRYDGVAALGRELLMRFNSNSEGIYYSRLNKSSTNEGSNGEGIATDDQSAIAHAILGPLITEDAAGAYAAAVAQSVVIDVINYRTSALYKTWLVRSLMPRAGAVLAPITLIEGGGIWEKVDPITEVRLFPGSGSLDAVSQVTLYGVR